MNAGQFGSTASIPCNLCGGTQIGEIADRDRDGAPLRTVMCRDCGLVWTDPRPDDAANRQFYAHDYRVSYKAAPTPRLKHAFRETRRAIARFRRIESLLQPASRVLDVGAGAGFFPYVLQSRGVDVQGIEPNAGFGRWGRETLGVRVQSGFLQDFDFTGQPFDLITLNHVLEHLPDPGAALATLRSWLKPEGFLVIEVPNIEADWHAPEKRFHIGHLYNFNPTNLLRLASVQGLAPMNVLLQPGTRHINVILRPCEPEPPGTERRLPENADHLAALLAAHTRIRHYASPVPHLRALRRLLGYLRERLAVMGARSGREVVDAELARQFNGSQI